MSDSLEDLTERALTEIWKSKTPNQRASLDQGDWEQGVMDALKWVAGSNNTIVSKIFQQGTT